ncbi:WecB/TagA/CpsF family glycosyltransferase [Candidatus Peregrinibacteria bacterium]|nr:WecB/TagA/CpsF family glycosyltransferase [Candidatus Peregrinibacteria bacterium]
MASRVHLLGVPVDALTRSEALTRLLGFLESGGKHHVMTPNSEMLVESRKNPKFREVLQRSALNFPDSQGLLLAARWTRQSLPERVTGVDTVQMLCATLDERHPVFLLGAGHGIAEQASEALQSRNPRLKIVGTFSGNPRREYAREIIAGINVSRPHLLFVAFGSPQQDIWIAEHLPELSSVRVAMGVGGTFDFLAGIQKRAPKFVRRIGMEWLWRFIQEPSRWKRIWMAVIVFPWLILRHAKTRADE